MAIFYTDTASIELLTVTNLTATTSSISYITQSQLNVENNLITVNTNSPQVRFGGFAVIDSGSSNLSGSLLFDSQNNQWIYVHQSAPSAATTSSVLIMGPQTFNDIGNEITIGTNKLTKGSTGDLGEHITSSNITDTGTLVSINSNTEVTGSLKVTTSISASSLTGSLFGTASWAQSASQALTASFLPIGIYQITASWAQSASQALTASFLPISTYAITASWANSASQALTASFLPTGTYNITSSWAQSASQAVSSSYALSASYAPGGGGVTINNNTDNYILTATGTANTVNGEANLQFDGSQLSVTGSVSASVYSGSAAGLTIQGSNFISPYGTIVFATASNAVTNVNSTTFVQLLSQTISGISVGDFIEVLLYGSYINNSGGTQTLTLSSSYGGLMNMSVANGATTANSATNRAIVELKLSYQISATNLAFGQQRQTIFIGAAANSAQSIATTGVRGAWQTTTGNATGTETITIGALSSAATATQTFTLHSCIITRTPTRTAI